jgi:hypothetical protein
VYKHKTRQTDTALHDGAVSLLTLLQITLLVVLSEGRIGLPLHAPDAQFLLAFEMPPLQPLHQTALAIGLVGADGPLAAADLHVAEILGEVVLGQEELGWVGLRGVFWSADAQGVCAVAQVEGVV